MNILVSDEQYVLNQLLMHCSLSSDHFRFDSEKISSSGLQAAFLNIAARRQKYQDIITEAIEQHGELPPAFDEDRQTLAKLYDQVCSALSVDELSVYIDHRLDFEKQVLEDLQQLKATRSMSDDTLQLVQSLQEEFSNTIQELEAMGETESES